MHTEQHDIRTRKPGLKPAVWLSIALLLALALVPALAQALEQPFWLAFFARILIYAIAATALNLVLGYGGLVSFGHALFLGMGVYAVALPAFHGMDSGWAHLALCLGSCGVVALLVGAISLRTAGMGFIMITLAFAQMGYFLFVSLKQYGGDDGTPVLATSRFGALDLGSPLALYSVSWAVLVASLIGISRLQRAPFGMALQAARQNTRRVSALGVPARRVQWAAFILSGMLCGIAGLLLANLNAFASPNSLAWTVSGDLIVMVVLGGMGTVTGPLLGALAFLGLEEVLQGLTQHWMALLGPVIVIMALAGRGGLAGLIDRLALRSNAGTVGRQ